MECRLCHATQGQSVRAPHVFGGRPEHKFWECESCGAIYLHPVLSAAEEAHFYRKEFEKFMSQRVGDHRDWSNAEKHVKTNQDQVERRWPFIAPHFRKGMDVLEIGCSSGFMLDRFRSEGARTTGVEPSGEFLEFVSKNGHEVFASTAELRQKDPQRRFDLITHFFVFEHIADPFQFIQEQLELLRPGGAIVAEIPSATDPLTTLFSTDAFEKFYWSIAHHYYYTPKSLKFVLDKMGVRYEMLPEQRYDLSNHITWMLAGKPGGQGKYSHIFKPATIEAYKADLRDKWLCDTVMLKIFK